MKSLNFTLIIVALLFLSKTSLGATPAGITHNATSKTISIAVPNDKLSLEIDYAKGCKISQLNIDGVNKLSPSGAFTGVSTTNKTAYTSVDTGNVVIKKGANRISISNVAYGESPVAVSETWTFQLVGNKILWSISRQYNSSTELDEIALPQWNFANLSTWKGGIMDNGGMVWCKYLSTVNDTFGVQTGGVTLWEPLSGDGLRISAKTDEGKHIATKYSHSPKDEFTITQFVTETELGHRYDLNRFVHQRADVFAPFNVTPGKITTNIEMEYVDYLAEYSRGTLPGIDADAVRELLNTTGRYGVVDNNIIGANGWITNWKCLHEPFFSLIGLALNDKNYTANMSSTLDQERDLAMLPDGRVLSRWHNASGDEMPGTYNPKTGYYEAMWGYTIDSQTGYIINTAEQFDLCGDTKWLESHKASCERALDWLIRRDSNGNGIFEMMNDNIAEQKASDWLDIVWASFENGFVNAQMYEALNLWANCEMILGDRQKSEYYTNVAARLKESFNKPVDQGGFWLPEKQQYIYWRDKDGSIHGDNLVTPVNFAVIAFGLCDDKERISLILNQIEQRNTAENLFHWPLCYDSFKREEVSGGNWPFPNYENGDIFPTWGYMGIRAYVNYDKDLALKYINNILRQYNKDGLSSQRYSRVTQEGLGSDILAGTCTSVVALYRDIYGVRPKWNRMGLEPNMSESLNGTDFYYELRDKRYRLQLSVQDYKMSADDFSIKSESSFGATKSDRKLTYWHDNKESQSIDITAASRGYISMVFNYWNTKKLSWTMTSSDKYKFNITGLRPNAEYKLTIDNDSTIIMSSNSGSISIDAPCIAQTRFELISKYD